MEPETIIEPMTCPLCGGSNECAPAGGEDGPCWCEQMTFPGNLREEIPPALRDLACVCRACVQRIAERASA